MRSSFQEMAAALSQQSIDAILQLSQSSRYGETQDLLGTWQTNALPIRHESETRPGTTTSELLRKKEAAIFATICRLNHSCQPNCHAEWNGALQQKTVHALVAIAGGEELTICYLPPQGLERKVRQGQVRSGLGPVLVRSGSGSGPVRSGPVRVR